MPQDPMFARPAFTGALPACLVRASVTLAVSLVVPSAAVAQIPAHVPASFNQPRAELGAPATPSAAADLDALVARALIVSPTLRVATARLAAARARVSPAGARPDPMLMAGVQNLPVSLPGFDDFMTMKMVGVSQTLPYPGKLALQTRIAERDVDVSRAALEEARREIVRRVREAYYDIAFADHALGIVARNQSALGDLVRVSEAHYAVGTGAQADVLRARLEQTRLATDASSLTEDRGAALARLNALLDQPSDAPLDAGAFPAALLVLASPDSTHAVHFTSAALGARAAGSPLLPLDTLQGRAEQASPMLREHEAMIAAQRSRVALARKASLPDFTVNVAYGQRNALSDMVTATVSIPLPLQRGRKQNEEVAADVADLDALEAEHREQLNALRAEIAVRYSDAERARTQLALLVSAMLPQARATLASATASFQVGRVGLEEVVDAQAITFHAETSYYRALADFGKAIAALEQVVGTGVVR